MEYLREYLMMPMPPMRPLTEILKTIVLMTSGMLLGSFTPMIEATYPTSPPKRHPNRVQVMVTIETRMTRLCIVHSFWKSGTTESACGHCLVKLSIAKNQLTTLSTFFSLHNINNIILSTYNNKIKEKSE
ncbi:hypothetical protein SAMN05444392_11087 [Seinonella peptonophila]|uniref:Uncharacterized protein n=1 Tax=Seinonella peptonophila TaxID=112248 RepID=A0A1M4ZSV8_9BACL|nr:hypothetical protein SAMN05444392_11087 [Seinonella peptonophila]